MKDKKDVSGTSEPLDPEVERFLALILQASRNGDQAEQEPVLEIVALASAEKVPA